MNVALIGCGAMAREHLRVLKNIDTLRLVALCDTNEETVSRVSGQWGVRRYYTNYSEMLEKEGPSIVSILTPPSSHAPLAVEAIERGVNVLVEKPLTMTTKEADLIMKSLATSQAKLIVNYNWLLSRVMTTALSRVRNGMIGEVLGMDVKVLNTKSDAMASDEKHWSHKMLGGRFGEMLSHPVYLAQSVLGNDLKTVTVLPDKRGAYSWMRYDELYALLRGSRGAVQVYASFNAPRPAILVDIYGEKKILKIDILNQTLIQLGPRKLDKKDSALDSLSVSTGLILNTVRNTARYLLSERGAYALGAAYRSLIATIRKNEPLVVTPDLAYNTVKIVEEICNAI